MPSPAYDLINAKILRGPQSMTVYVDGYRGNDANDGLTPNTALLNPGAVLKVAPYYVCDGADVEVKVAGPAGFDGPYPNGTRGQYYGGDTCDEFWVGGGSSVVPNYRWVAPRKVPWTPPFGPQSSFLASVFTVGQRTYFECEDEHGDPVAWNAGTLRAKYVRAVRGGDEVYAELPICGNDGQGSFWIDVAGLETIYQAGDEIQLVWAAVKLFGRNGILAVKGNSSFLAQTRPNYKGHVWKDFAFGPMLSSGFAGCIGHDGCELAGEVNHQLCSVYFVNCVATGIGVLLQDIATCHDQDGSKPFPGQLVVNEDKQMELLLSNSQLFIGSRTCGQDGTYSAQRNISSYGAGANAITVDGGKLYMFYPPQNQNRPCVLHVEGAGKCGMRIMAGGQARINPEGNLFANNVQGDIALGQGTALTLADVVALGNWYDPVTGGRVTTMNEGS